MTAARTVADLQRELLAICRGTIDLGSGVRRSFRVQQLRDQIIDLDLEAALYFGWAPGDAMGDEAEFRARHALRRRQDDQLAAAEAGSLYGMEHAAREVLA